MFDRLKRRFVTPPQPPEKPGRQFDLAGFDDLLTTIRGERPDADEYQALAEIRLNFPQAGVLTALDPFSASYRTKVLELYFELRRRGDGYDIDRDEASEIVPITNLFADLPPWNFGDPGLVSEFFHAWGQILRLLDLPPGQPSRVLEYGCSSGQLLLMLARLRIDAFGVDIDAQALGQLRAQAETLGLKVRADQAAFGEGFGEERFDRLIFFEAFHHALDAPQLLRRLRRRLKPGGRLLLCGEPVVEASDDTVPYPWGPRLDGLSVYCIRRYGWMELGFTRAFLTEAMRRAGWDVTEHAFPQAARATTFVATPTAFDRIAPIVTLQVDDRSCDWLDGWHSPESSQRWTTGGDATVRLPAFAIGADIAVLVSNHMPVAKAVSVSSGARTVSVTLDPAERGREIFLPAAADQVLHITCVGHRPCALIAGSDDQRELGIAVQSVTIEPPEIRQ